MLRKLLGVTALALAVSCTPAPLSITPAPAAPVSILQTASIDSSSTATSLTPTFTNPITAGSAVVIVYGSTGVPSAVAYSDDVNSTYSSAVSLTTSGFGTTVSAGISLTPNTNARAITVTPTGPGQFEGACAFELAGLTAMSLDKTNTNGGATSTSPTSGSTGTLTGSNQGVFSLIIGGGSPTSGSLTTDGAFTQSGPNTIVGCVAGIVANTTAQTASYTVNTTSSSYEAEILTIQGTPTSNPGTLLAMGAGAQVGGTPPALLPPPPAQTAGFTTLAYQWDASTEGTSTIYSTGTTCTGKTVGSFTNVKNCLYTAIPSGGHTATSCFSVIAGELKLTCGASGYNGSIWLHTLESSGQGFLADPSTGTGTAKGYYAVITMRFDPTQGTNANGWPSWWGNTTQWPSGSRYCEFDIFEAYPLDSPSGYTAEYSGGYPGGKPKLYVTLIDWTAPAGTSRINQPYNFSHFTQNSGVDVNKPHDYGGLMTPTSATWFFDSIANNDSGGIVQNFSSGAAPSPAVTGGFTGQFTPCGNQAIQLTFGTRDDGSWPLFVKHIEVWVAP